MPKKHRYEVSGPGHFPEDMLRYDCAKIIGQRVDEDNPKRMIYTIEGDVAPTVGRWNSFLWAVKGWRS